MAAQFAGRQGIAFSVFDKVRAALPELEMYVVRNALFPNIEHPRIVERSGVFVRFAADND